MAAMERSDLHRASTSGSAPSTRSSRAKRGSLRLKAQGLTIDTTALGLLSLRRGASTGGSPKVTCHLGRAKSFT